jgi:hypothetical protein
VRFRKWRDLTPLHPSDGWPIAGRKESVLGMLSNETADTVVDFPPLRQEVPAVAIVDMDAGIVEKQNLTPRRNDQPDFDAALKKLMSGCGSSGMKIFIPE